MTAVVLHLSDIHIRSEKDPILSNADAIATAAYEYLPDASVVFVVVSGDIAWSGDKDEYAAASKFLQRIALAIRTEREIPIYFVVVPGNHDCDFRRNENSRLLMLQAARSDITKIDASVIAAGCAVQRAYEEFADELVTPNGSRSGNRLWTSHTFTVEGKTIAFDAINVSWCSSLKEDPGTIIFPFDQYANLSQETTSLRIAVMHHPLNWFNQAAYHPFRRFVRTIANVVITGHEHIGGAGEDFNAESGHSAYVEGCVLQGDDGIIASSFNIVELNLVEETYCVTRYRWSQDDIYLPTEEGSWNDFRAMPHKSSNRLGLTDAVIQIISDPGGAFQPTKGAPISLGDIFTYPDMQRPMQDREHKKILSTSVLLDSERLNNGIVLSGEEKVGATSLLFMLFQHYHERGMFPLYMRGADFRSERSKDIDRAIEKAATEQYGVENLQRFLQTTTQSKLLLIDDFDDGPLKSSQHRATLLVELRKRAKHTILTVSELFDFESNIRKHAANELADMDRYAILPMGYTLRARLIKKWLQRTSGDGSLDDSAFLAKCDQLERFLDAVMARNIVPSLPLYLLTLLQSFDAGLSGGFEESGLAEYYDFLVKQSLQTVGVPKNSWGSFIQYCSHLAWRMHKVEHKELSKREVVDFTREFSEQEHRVDVDDRLKALVKARILSESGGFFRFRYHYIFYFLKGRYLAMHLGEDEVLAHVSECCHHLYVREYANTILFLAHHSFQNPAFLSCIVESVSSPFKNSNPITFASGDTTRIADIVQDLPRIKYSGESPEVARDRLNRQRDATESDDDGLLESKSENGETEFLPQMVSLFKSIEILGQILKNQMANVSRAQRVELLQLIMNGPLRALRAYFDLLLEHKDQAVLDLAERLGRRKLLNNDVERVELARKLLAFFVQSTAFAFVCKAVTSISSDVLTEDIAAAAKIVGTPAIRLIAIGAQLDSPNGLPQGQMQDLMKETSTDFIAARVLQLLTLRRLYMFRTSEHDKQWLASQRLLDIRTQHAIEYRTRRSKLLRKR